MVPYAINGFKIENFKGIQSCEIGGLPKEASWIFLTGENGFGKTSILQGLAIVLHGFEKHTLDFHPMISGERGISLGITFCDANIDKSLRYKRQIKEDFEKICCYGSSRLNMEGEKSTREKSPTINLFKTTTFLQNIEFQLSRWYFKQNDIEFKEKYENVSELLIKLLNLSKITVDKKTDKVYYFEKDANNEEYQGLEFHQLAAGYRSIISMIGDMILRLFESQPKITSPKDLEGIVIIDELDLHFHPKWQRQIPSLFSELFPKILFIASTHSAIPILGAPKNSVLLRVNRSVKSGIMVERLIEMEEKLKNFTPNLLLSSPVFGLRDIFSEQHHGNASILTEETYDELKLNEAVAKRLHANASDPDQQRLYEDFMNSLNSPK